MPSQTYLLIIGTVQKYLKSTNSVGPYKSKSNKQIVQAVRDAIDKGDLPVTSTDGTIVSYLSNAANWDEDSAIVSGGPRGGYWYDLSAEQAPEPKEIDTATVKLASGSETKVSEKDLYPLMELWLASKSYVAKDTSSVRKGGRWGNPDIIGISRTELLGCIEVELASCEVKLAAYDWEHWIFEAISHKRFSNRSWFCYRVSDQGQPLPKGMEYYAERYRVGVVQIVLNDREFAKLKEDAGAALDLLERVEERVPALYDHVSLRDKSELIDRTGVEVAIRF